MRLWLGGAVLLAALAESPSSQQVHGPVDVPPCSARAVSGETPPIVWHAGPIEDTDALDRWCRGVGPPLMALGSENPAEISALEDLVVLTWNTHLAEGRLTDLIGELRSGALTDGRPIRHFVLLLQELFRRGSDVPRFATDVRSAYAIKARNPNAPDARDYAAALGLSIVYVPSMRNGPELQEDRGNAIVSTEPLIDPFAFELPFERQRRVAIGAAIRVRSATGVRRL